MNIGGTAVVLAPEGFTSEQAPQAPATASEQEGHSSFAELLAEAGAQPAKPVTAKAQEKAPHKTPGKTPEPEAKQKTQANAVTMLLPFVQQIVTAPETPPVLTLELSLGSGTGNSETAPAKAEAAAAAPAAGAPEAGAPAVSMEAPIAFTADIPLAADEVPQAKAQAHAPANQPQAAAMRVKTPAAEEPVKQAEAAKPATEVTEVMMPAHAVTRVEQPAAPKMEVETHPEPAPRAHEALRDSQPVAETEAAAVPAARKVQEISIRVQGEDQQNAEVRVQNRGGELHVAVRTADARLTESLRSDLGELVSRLDRTGLEARVWHPAATPAAAETPQSSNQSYEDRREQPRWNNSQRQSRDRRRRDAQQQEFKKQIEAIA